MTGFKVDDPRWIGAWWLGILIMAFVLAAYALLMAAFPRRIRKEKQEAESPQHTPPTMTIRRITLVIDDTPTRQERVAGSV